MKKKSFVTDFIFVSVEALDFCDANYTYCKVQKPIIYSHGNKDAITNLTKLVLTRDRIYNLFSCDVHTLSSP